MKRILFSLCLLLFICTNTFAGNNGFRIRKMDRKANIGLFMAFSGVDNKHEDDNVIAEIYNGHLWLTNKTNRTIYLDLAQCFTYFNERPNCLYVPEKKRGKDVITETQLFTIAPNTTEPIAYLGAQLMGTYSAYEGEHVKDITDEVEKFMGIVDELRNEFEKKQCNSVSRHLTEDESFMKLKAAISYSFNREVEESTPIVVTTWLSDITLSKYYNLLPPPLQRKRNLAAKKARPILVCIAAHSPFEYENEKSPMFAFEININLTKGQFELTNPVQNDVESYDLDQPGKVSQVTKSNTVILQWIGDDTDFSTIDDDVPGIVTFGESRKGNMKIVQNKYY